MFLNLRTNELANMYNIVPRGESYRFNVYPTSFAYEKKMLTIFLIPLKLDSNYI